MDYKNDLSSRVRKGIGTITDTLTYRVDANVSANTHNGIVYFTVVKTCLYANSVYALNIPISIVYKDFFIFYSFISNNKVLSIVAKCMNESSLHHSITHTSKLYKNIHFF